MTLGKIHDSIVELAMEEMTENGIHHDDFPDYEGEYVQKILEDLNSLNN